jgi:uracil phosphoribosyltransferase
VPPHPLIKHWLAVARNAQTPPAIFKSAITELSKILLYECVRDMLPTQEAQVETPMGVLADVEYVDPAQPIAVVPVLRAGLAMAESTQTIVPASVTYHVGYVRDEETLRASSYLNKLPESFDMDSKIVVMDIMLATGMLTLAVLWNTSGNLPEESLLFTACSATCRRVRAGGTICQVIDDIISRGAVPENIRVLSIVAASKALTTMSEKYEGMSVYTAMIDAEVNENGYIIPGLGDAGDRCYGTL